MSTDGSNSAFSLNCPDCNQLCLGPAILTCGHLVCRKCLRRSLTKKELDIKCKVCTKAVELPPNVERLSIAEIIQTFPKDVALESLIDEELFQQENLKCKVCIVPNATKICLDCREMYCHYCSSAHEGMEVAQDHVQMDLPLNFDPSLPMDWTATAANLEDDTSSNASTIPQDSVTIEGQQNHDNTAWITELGKALKEDAEFLNSVELQAEYLSKLAKERAKMLNTYSTNLHRFKMADSGPSQALLNRLSDLRYACMENLGGLSPSVHNLWDTNLAPNSSHRQEQPELSLRSVGCNTDTMASSKIKPKGKEKLTKADSRTEMPSYSRPSRSDRNRDDGRDDDEGREIFLTMARRLARQIRKKDKRPAVRRHGRPKILFSNDMRVSSGRAVYVGVSRDPMRRWKQHPRTSGKK